MAKSITVDELFALRRSGEPHALIDVREKGDFVQEHIFRAVPIPRGLLEVRMPSRVPDRRIPVIVYDAGGDRAKASAITLENIGFQDVRVLDGGLAAWKDAGHRTDYGTNVPGKDYGEKVAVRHNTPHLTPDQVVERQKSGEQVVVLDSRTREEYERSHVPGAYLAPGGELPVRIHSILSDPDQRDATLVVNCAGRTRSILGADVLQRMDLPNPIYALENGTMAWSMAGYELESGPGRELPRPEDPETRRQVEAFARRVAEEDGVPAISVDEFIQLRASRPLHYLVDVRLPDEFVAARIPGSLSLPAGQFALAADEILAVNQAEIILYSESDIRSRIAGSLAKRLGYPNVRYLQRGLNAWRSRGMLVESGELAPTPVPGLTEAEAETQSIEPTTLLEQINSGSEPTIIDVKGSGDYALAHIAGSVWIPRGDLERRIEDIAPDRSTHIVVTCNDGVRSCLAAATLQVLGYKNVTWLRGGLDAWQASGLDVVQGLDGADVDLKVAKDDVEMIGRIGPLARNRQDMIDYLEWEIALGDKYETEDGAEDW